MDQIAKNIAGPNAGQLVGVADQQYLGAGADPAKQLFRQQDVHHGTLVHYHKISLQRLQAFGVVSAAVCFGNQPQGAVQRPGRQAGAFHHAAGGAAGWGGLQNAAAL